MVHRDSSRGLFLEFWNIIHFFFFLEKEMSDYTEKVDSYMMKDEAH